MEHVAEAAGVQRLGHLVLSAQFADKLVIELRRAEEVALEGRGRQHAFPDGPDVVLRLRDGVPGGGQLHAGRSDEALQRYPVMVFQLLDIAAFLPRFQSFRAAVPHEPDLLRPLDHPVEIVSPHAVLVLIRGQAETLPEFRRDEGSAHAAARKRTLVRRQDHDVPEIQGAGFQWPHHLQAFQRFAAERDGFAREELVQQVQPGGRQYLHADSVQDVERHQVPFGEVQFQQHRLHFPEFPADITDDSGQVFCNRMVLCFRHFLGLPDYRPEQQVEERAALQVRLRNKELSPGLHLPHDGLFLRRKGGPQQAVREDGTHVPVIEKPAARLLPQPELHRRHGGHEGIDGPARQGQAHGYVHPVLLRRNGIEQGHQQVLVRQDEGRLDRIVHPAAGQDVGGQFRLSGGGRDTDHMESRPGKPFRIHLECVREFPDIVPQEEGGLVAGIPDGLGHKVPGELRQSRITHPSENRFFALVQRIEADEDKTADAGKGLCEHIGHGRSPFQALGEVAIDHSFVGHFLLPEAFPEIDIERVQDIPDLEEAGLDRGFIRIQMHRQAAVPVAEMGDKAQDGLPLNVGQVAIIVLDALEIGHVGKEALRIHQVLVHIVEIREDHLAPENELIEGFRLGEDGPVGGVQFQQEPDAVRHFAAIDPIKEIIDGEGHRGMKRTGRSALPHQVAEILPKEDPGAAVRENKACIL